MIDATHCSSWQILIFFAHWKADRSLFVIVVASVVRSLLPVSILFPHRGPSCLSYLCWADPVSISEHSLPKLSDVLRLLQCLFPPLPERETILLSPPLMSAPNALSMGQVDFWSISSRKSDLSHASIAASHPSLQRERAVLHAPATNRTQLRLLHLLDWLTSTWPFQLRHPVSPELHTQPMPLPIISQDRRSSSLSIKSVSRFPSSPSKRNGRHSTPRSIHEEIADRKSCGWFYRSRQDAQLSASKKASAFSCKARGDLRIHTSPIRVLRSNASGAISLRRTKRTRRYLPPPST